MNNQEKYSRKLKNQSKRLRRLLWTDATIGILLLFGATILLGLGIRLKTVELRGPENVRFGAYSTAYGFRGNRSILTTETGERFTLYHSTEVAEIRTDQENGTLKPGDAVTIFWYPWLGSQKMVAAVSSRTKDYGSLDTFKSAHSRDVHATLISGGLLAVLWIGTVILFLWSDRKQIAEIWRLRKKYRSKINKKEKYK